jgi:hypothetical protein
VQNHFGGIIFWRKELKRERLTTAVFVAVQQV